MSGGQGRRRASTRRDREAPLPALAEDTIRRLTRVLDAGEFSRTGVARALRQAASELEAAPPRDTQRNSRKPTRPRLEVVQAGAFVSEWSSDGGYMEADGETPRILPLAGRRSIKALAQKVAPRIEIEELLRYLVETRTVERVGRRFKLVRPWVRLREARGPYTRHVIRIVNEGLRAAENNLRPESEAVGWLERVAEERIPESFVPKVRKDLERVGWRFLRSFNRNLRDYSLRRCQRGERRVWVGILLQWLQHEASGRGVQRRLKLPRARP